MICTRASGEAVGVRAAAQSAASGVLERVRGRPVGGFVIIKASQLLTAWFAYSERLIRYRDLRVWFALWELRAQRVASGRECEARYEEWEVLKLVGGVGGAGIRSAMRRLERAGLGTFNRGMVAFAESPEDLRAERIESLLANLRQLEMPGRRVPVPRHTLALLAGGARRAVVATILGVLVRCLFAAPQTCVSGGRIKSSWISRLFTVDLRRVKAARRHLEELGWMRSFPSASWKENRWGRVVVVELDWSRQKAERASRPVDNARPAAPAPMLSTSGLPPRTQLPTTELPPPESNQTLPPTEELRNQNLPRTGAFASGKEERKLPPPTMRNVLKEDLRNPGRMLRLFEEATKLGLVNGSDADRLRFMALAEYAAVIGTTNPPGLFVSLMRRKLWHYATQSDEDAVCSRLKAYFRDLEPRSEAVGEVRERPKPTLSADAQFVRALRNTLEQRGIRTDPFLALSEMRPEWTAERWEQAIAELAIATHG